MNDDNYDQTLAELKTLGLIDDKAVNENTSSDESSPWFINVFFGFTGILASVFFVGFLTLVLFETAVFDSFIGLVIVGALLSFAGWFLFHNARTRHSVFWNSLAFAITLAGQLYITFALLFEGFKQPLSVLIVLLMQLFMTIALPNFIYRLLSATVTLICFIYLFNFYYLSEIGLGFLAFITVITNLQRYSLLQKTPIKWRISAFSISKAFAYASAIVLLGISIYFIAAEYGYGIGGYEETFSYSYYLAQGLLTLASLYAAYLILKRYQVKLLSATGLIIVCSVTVLGVMSIYVSGLLATSLIIIIATANSQRVLLGIGIFTLVSYIFWYYYQLDTSLLIKSVSMLIIGIVLLLMRWLLFKRYSR